jgi:predicted house-cleaning NTP pyrophosphatase (Maf/HAM1 superfamily)
LDRREGDADSIIGLPMKLTRQLFDELLLLCEDDAIAS